MTCSIHTNYGLRHRLAPNKWYPKICINTRNAEKITKGSKCPCGHERRRAKNHCVHQPVKTKYDTASPRSGARSIRIHIVHHSKNHISKMWRWHISYFWEMAFPVVVLQLWDCTVRLDKMLDVRCYIFNVVLQPSCDSLPTRPHRFDARNHTKNVQQTRNI